MTCKWLFVETLDLYTCHLGEWTLNAAHGSWSVTDGKRYASGGAVGVDQAKSLAEAAFDRKRKEWG